MGTAVEEMIRWVTPVKEFMRTAVRGRRRFAAYGSPRANRCC